MSRSAIVRSFVTAVIGAIFLAACSSNAQLKRWYVLNDPIASSQLSDLSFGYRSFWLQPWRSQMVTRPAFALEDSIGINIDNRVTSAEVPQLARLLHDRGIERARMEVNWNGMSYSHPSELSS